MREQLPPPWAPDCCHPSIILQAAQQAAAALADTHRSPAADTQSVAAAAATATSSRRFAAKPRLPGSDVLSPQANVELVVQALATLEELRDSYGSAARSGKDGGRVNGGNHGDTLVELHHCFIGWRSFC